MGFATQEARMASICERLDALENLVLNQETRIQLQSQMIESLTDVIEELVDKVADLEASVNDATRDGAIDCLRIDTLDKDLETLKNELNLVKLRIGSLSMQARTKTLGGY